MIYALAVIVTLSVTTAVVVALIIRAPLWEEEGDESVGISFDTKERSEVDRDEATSVGAGHAED